MKNPSDLFTPVTTDRFVVRVLTEDDVTDIYLGWFDDEVIAAHIKAASSRQTLGSLRAFVREKRDSPAALLLGIFTSSPSIHIGNLKFEPIDARSGTAIVGVMIGDPQWRNAGVFRETFQAAAAKLSALMGVHTFWLAATTHNGAAITAYRKTGFIPQEPPRQLYPVIIPDVIYMAYLIAG